MNIAVSLFTLSLILCAGIAIGFLVAVHPGLKPISEGIIRLGNFITPGRAFRARPYANEEELRDLVDEASERGLVENSEAEMIHSVFELDDTLIRELMVPRTDVVWIESTKTVRQGLSLALRSGFTRIPVIDENLDNVIGIAYVKDLAKRVHEHRESEQTETVAEHLRPATFVPETKTAGELLKEMQRHQTHMAIVIDEYGGVAGLITIEDILEEIVGEIADEYDTEGEAVEWLARDTARLSAMIRVEDFEVACSIILPDEVKEDVDTLGGLLAKSLGRVPITGSTVTFENWHLTAERPVGRRHRIAYVLATKIGSQAEVASNGDSLSTGL